MEIHSQKPSRLHPSPPRAHHPSPQTGLLLRSLSQPFLSLTSKPTSLQGVHPQSAILSLSKPCFPLLSNNRSDHQLSPNAYSRCMFPHDRGKIIRKSGRIGAINPPHNSRSCNSFLWWLWRFFPTLFVCGGGGCVKVPLLQSWIASDIFHGAWLVLLFMSFSTSEEGRQASPDWEQEISGKGQSRSSLVGLSKSTTRRGSVSQNFQLTVVGAIVLPGYVSKVCVQC